MALKSFGICIKAEDHINMNKTVTAVIVAAGSSSRMGFNKLAYRLHSGTVLETSVRAFEQHPYINDIVVVTGTDEALAKEAVKNCKKTVTLVRGGETRAVSVKNGVMAAAGELVAIHDAARPFVSEKVITDALNAAEKMGAAAPAVAVKDTVKMAEKGIVEQTPPREKLFAVQTPQCFDRTQYLNLLEKNADFTVTDDCQLFEAAGLPVQLTEGDYNNYKITTPDDLKGAVKMRIGHGYDVHKLVEGRRLILGGVEIPYEKGLLGHSDADVLAHAVMDAVLGAVALGDIGKHFPDTDPAYKGADSLELTRHVAALIQKEGWQIENIDSTILCQAPKLAPHIVQMRQNLADALGLQLEDVSVKATTEERLGFTGAGEGIAVHAVALLTRRA